MHNEAKQMETSEFATEKVLLQGQAKKNRWLGLSNPEFSDGFQGEVFNRQNSG